MRKYKLNQDMASIKVWLIFVNTLLLLGHYVSDVVWAGVISTLLGLRSFDEYKQQKHEQEMKGE